jgi:hypothetical protein
MAWTLLEAGRAAGAFVVVVAVAQAGAELDDRVLRTSPIAIVALEAVAAAQAALRLPPGFLFCESGDDLAESLGALAALENLLHGRVRVAEHRQIEHGEIHHGRARRYLVLASVEPGVDMPSRQLSMTDRDGDGSLARHHVAAGEHARMAGHHVGSDHDGSVLLEIDSRHAAQEAGIGVLAQREHDRVGLELFELSGRARPAFLVQLHHLDRQRRAGDLLDAGEPLDLDALLERLVGLERVRRHVGAVAAVDDQGLFGTEALGGSRRIHGGVAAAVDHHAATEARRFADAHAAQQAHGVEHVGDVARRYVDVFRYVSTDRDEHGIEPAVCELAEKVLDLVVEDDAHAYVLDAPDFLHEVFPRQPVYGNAEMHHAARRRAGFVDLDRMT